MDASGADLGQCIDRAVGTDWGLAPSKVTVAAGGPKEPARL